MNQVEAKASLVEMLHSLGEDDADVADNLLKKECYGKRESACDCPVARRIKKHAVEAMGADVCDVWVEAEGVCLNLGTTGPTVRLSLETPDMAAVREFIVQFDAGEYIELEEPGSDEGGDDADEDDEEEDA